MPIASSFWKTTYALLAVHWSFARIMMLSCLKVRKVFAHTVPHSSKIDPNARETGGDGRSRVLLRIAGSHRGECICPGKQLVKYPDCGRRNGTMPNKLGINYSIMRLCR